MTDETLSSVYTLSLIHILPLLYIHSLYDFITTLTPVPTTLHRVIHLPLRLISQTLVQEIRKTEYFVFLCVLVLQTNTRYDHFLFSVAKKSITILQFLKTSFNIQYFRTVQRVTWVKSCLLYTSRCV